MKLTQKMQDAINAQINLEMWSANLYLSMSVHFAQIGLDGFAHWLHMQSKEEVGHAEDMMHYLIVRGGQVKIGTIEKVPTEFGSPLDIAKEIYKHECLISEKIQQIISVASGEKDMPSQDFFWKYIREQVEEEATANNLVEQLTLADDNKSAILILDREFANRGK